MAGTEFALATGWAQAVADGERPAPYSSREGVRLRKVASCDHLTRQQLARLLAGAFVRHCWLVPVLEAASFIKQQPRSVPGVPLDWSSCMFTSLIDQLRHACFGLAGRHALALARAVAYAQHGNMQQAQRDARAALAFGGSCSDPASRCCLEAAAHCMLATALHGLEDWTAAAFHMHKVRAPAALASLCPAFALRAALLGAVASAAFAFCYNRPLSLVPLVGDACTWTSVSQSASQPVSQSASQSVNRSAR